MIEWFNTPLAFMGSGGNPAPDWFIYSVVLAFGLVVGSFLNVVIYRLPRDESVAWPASRCPQCQRPIRWYENLPVVSYLALRGKCRGCEKKISLQYPVVELLTALLFLFTVIRFGLTPLVIVRDLPLVASLIAVTFIDLEHRIIPDQLSLGGLVWGLATAWLTQDLGLLRAFIGAAAGFGIFYGFSWLYYLYAKRVGLGGGDVKLLAMLGAYVGFSGVLSTILLSSIAGSVIGVGWALINRKRDVMSVAIPYGPFLVFGALYTYYFRDLLWFPFTILT
ncbi:MAG: A24 family peptidase [Bacteriovoracia bacterium]